MKGACKGLLFLLNSIDHMCVLILMRTVTYESIFVCERLISDIRGSYLISEQTSDKSNGTEGAHAEK
jgi:hypothetical protein